MFAGHDKDGMRKRASPTDMHRAKMGKTIGVCFIAVVLLASAIFRLSPIVVDMIMESQSDVEVIPVSVRFNGFDEYGGASVKEALTDGTHTVLLYPTFDNKAKAFATTRQKAKPALDFIRRSFFMYIPFTSLTWDIFKKASFMAAERSDCPDGYTSSDAFVAIQKFCDLYENDEENRLLKRTVFTQGLTPEITRYLVTYTGQEEYVYNLPIENGE